MIDIIDGSWISDSKLQNISLNEFLQCWKPSGKPLLYLFFQYSKILFASFSSLHIIIFINSLIFFTKNWYLFMAQVSTFNVKLGVKSYSLLLLISSIEWIK